MENSFQTSFIPKKPITSNVSNREPKSFLYIITIFILIASILISLGLFGYKMYLTKQKDSISTSLVNVRETFDTNNIDELNLFNKRTEVAKDLLNKHIATSKMFTLLGELTIPSVQYTKFEQQTDDKGSYVKIEGISSDYKAIAQQADMFNSSKGNFFENVIFSNLIKDKNNNVTFNLEFKVNPSLLSYGSNLLGNQTQ